MDCLFCKIVAGKIPSAKVYEDDRVLAFRDIAPQAPVHIVVIPKAHVAACADEITPENAGAVGDVFAAVARIAREQKLDGGYRVINNCGADAHQSVPHIHFHILAGKDLGETLC